MQEPSGPTLTLVAAASFGISILCSMAKIVLTNFSPAKLQVMLETERNAKYLHRFLERRGEVLIGVTLVGTFANMAFVAGVILCFSQHGSISNEELLYGLVLSFCPLIVFGKAIPEAMARLQPERHMSWSIAFSRIIYWLFWWLVWPVHRLTGFCENLLGSPSNAPDAGSIEKEILQVVSEGQEKGLLQEEEKDMIEGIMELKDSEVREVMTPRTEMFSIPLETPIQKAISLAIETGHSRIPIYRENRDDIVGILYIKDILKWWDDEKRDEVKIEDLMRKSYFIPETKEIGSLLKDFQEQKQHMAIVLDEYGGTAGIVTIEDIIEEIVGDILDEYDSESLEPISRIDENVVEVDARMHVDELNEELELDLPLDEGYETIGGFLFTQIGHIPAKGETCRYGNAEFVVLDASERRVNRVKVIKK